MIVHLFVSILHFSVSSPALIGIYVGGSLFLATILAVSCFCYKKRSPHHEEFEILPKCLPYKAVVIKRPIKNSECRTYYLKKSLHQVDKMSVPKNKALDLKEGNDKSDAYLQNTNTYGNQIEPLKFISDEDVNKNKCASSETMPVSNSLTKKNSAGFSYLGEIHFNYRYLTEKNALVVGILKCTNLFWNPTKISSYDPYVKLQLLPNKQGKVKTRVLRGTTNPVYEEDFAFYGIDPSQLEFVTLHFVVFRFDRFSRDEIIGELKFPLNTQEATEGKSIIQRIVPRMSKFLSQSRGEILISICYQPVSNKFTVVVLKARNLPKMDVIGYADPYVKIYFLAYGRRIAKRRTNLKKRTLNPVFNQTFTFDIPEYVSNANELCFEFLVLDWDRMTKDELIGMIQFSSSSSTASAVEHWKEVFKTPRRQIAEWHNLAESSAAQKMLTRAE